MTEKFSDILKHGVIGKPESDKTESKPSDSVIDIDRVINEAYEGEQVLQPRMIVEYAQIKVPDKDLNPEEWKEYFRDKLKKEKEWYDNFVKEEKTHIDQADNILKEICQDESIDYKRLKVLVISPLEAILKYYSLPKEKRPLSLFTKKYPCGEYSETFDEAYVYPKWTMTIFVHSYIHEGIHSLGITKLDDDGRVGSKGLGGSSKNKNPLFEEGFAEALTQDYVEKNLEKLDIDQSDFKEAKRMGYPREVKFIRELVKNIGWEPLKAAHFHGDYLQLAKSIDEQYGDGAYQVFRSDVDKIYLMAGHPKEMKVFMKIKNGISLDQNEQSVIPRDMLEDIIFPYLREEFVINGQKLLRDINERFFTNRKTQEEIKEELKDQYPEEIIDIFIEKRLDFFSDLVKSNKTIKDFMNQSIEGRFSFVPK